MPARSQAPEAVPGPARTGLVPVGEVELAYEEFGDPAGETLLLVMGLGMQLTAWDERFCAGLVECGYRVIRFDNRDVGLSSKLRGKVNVLAGMVGITGSALYDLGDMAADTAGLLDALEIEAAHLVGASMGAMISQTVAARYPGRVRSLCSIMAGTGRRTVSTLPRLGTIPVLLGSPPSRREDYIDRAVETFKLIGSPEYPPDEDRLRERAARAYDRCFHPAGTARQLMAVLASGNRTEELKRIGAPTIVVHGTDDPLVPVAAGRDVAEAIPTATFHPIEGMGHDLPEQLWPELIDLISANARAAVSA